jgi:hypothetical protein
VGGMGSVRVGRNAYVHFTLSFLILEEGSRVAKRPVSSSDVCAEADKHSAERR